MYSAKDVDERHSKAFDPLGLASDLTLDSLENIKEEAVEKNTVIIRRPFICCSSPHGPEATEHVQTVYRDGRRGTERYLRSLMDFNYPKNGGVPIDEVESVDEIVKRFKTGAMSYDFYFTGSP